MDPEGMDLKDDVRFYLPGAITSTSGDILRKLSAEIPSEAEGATIRVQISRKPPPNAGLLR
jgi:hypothetical protein